MRAFLIGAGVAGSCDRVIAQCDSYQVEAFRGPTCGIFGIRGAYPQAISESGTIVGYSGNCNLDQQGFVWTGGPAVTLLPNVGGFNQSHALDVNSYQQIAGTRSSETNFNYRGFIFANGSYTALGDLLNSNFVEPRALNDLGHACGLANNTGTGPQRAFLWQNGVMSALELPQGPNAVANDINNASQIVGWMGSVFGSNFPAEAFLWQNGVAIGLGVPPGGLSSDALAISDNGQVAGQYMIELRPSVFVKRAFHWRDGVFTDLGLLPGCVQAVAVAINDRGEIVGNCSGGTAGNVPFIWREGVMTDLRTLVALPVDVRLIRAWDINNQGQIAAEGRDDSSSPPNGPAPGFRLTPRSKVPGDCNCDHVVNIDDLQMIIQRWGPNPGGGHAPADLNQDHIVNVTDLLTVLANWS